jgi:hypothetical protein
MDRKIFEEHYLRTEEHVPLGAQHLARQRELVAELQNEGHGTREARKVLGVFSDLQDAHIAHRDRQKQELADRDRGRRAPG